MFGVCANGLGDSGRRLALRLAGGLGMFVGTFCACEKRPVDTPPRSPGSSVSPVDWIGATSRPLQVDGRLDFGDVWAGESAAKEFALPAIVGDVRVTYAASDCSCAEVRLLESGELADQALSVVLSPVEQSGPLQRNIVIATTDGIRILALVASILPAASLSNTTFDLRRIEAGKESSSSVTITCQKPEPFALEIADIKEQ